MGIPMNIRIPHISFLALAFITLAACTSDPLPATKDKSAYTPESTTIAQLTDLPRLHEAVGTVKARTDIRVEAQVTGRVLKVLVRPGDKVKTAMT